MKIGNQITEAKRIKTLASFTNDIDKEDYGDLEKDQTTFSIGAGGKGIKTTDHIPNLLKSTSKNMEKSKSFNQAPRSQSIAQYLHTQKDKIVEEEKEELAESSLAASVVKMKDVKDKSKSSMSFHDEGEKTARIEPFENRDK